MEQVLLSRQRVFLKTFSYLKTDSARAGSEAICLADGGINTWPLCLDGLQWSQRPGVWGKKDLSPGTASDFPPTPVTRSQMLDKRALSLLPAPVLPPGIPEQLHWGLSFQWNNKILLRFPERMAFMTGVGQLPCTDTPSPIPRLTSPDAHMSHSLSLSLWEQQHGCLRGPGPEDAGGKRHA